MKELFREITLAEFKAFTDACVTKNYMQSPDMYNRYLKIGREAYLFGAFSNGKLVVAGLASVIYERFGKKIFTFSCGPLADFSQSPEVLCSFLENCKEELKKKNGIVLQITPYLRQADAPKDFKHALTKKAGFKYLGEYEQVKWIYSIEFDKIADLPKQAMKSKKTPILNPQLDPELEHKLLQSFRRDHRYSIKYATSRYNLKIRELPVDEYQILYDQILESGKFNGFVPRDVEFFRQMKDAFNDEVAAMAVETPDGVPIAAAFFILYGDEVIYLSSGFTREYKKYGAPHLIQWTMIKYAYANGYKKYNFWGTKPDPNNGVYQFKQGFHGEEEELVGAFAAPLNIIGRLYLAKIHTREQRDL